MRKTRKVKRKVELPTNFKELTKNWSTKTLLKHFLHAWHVKVQADLYRAALRKRK